MTITDSLNKLVEAIGYRIRQRRKRDTKAGISRGGVGSIWEAMIFQEAGPNRSGPIRPAGRVQLDRRS